MIKVSELRIGNLIYFDNQLCEVDLITLEYISVPNNGYSPISLTEEWLLKFGFKKTDFFNIGIISAVEVYEEAAFYFYFGKDGDNGIKIQHVHQLQNLYFALTGEELTINK